MAFDLARITEELAGVPPYSPYPVELAAAVVADVARLAGRAPVDDAWWAAQATARGPRFAEQLSMIAHLLSHTSLRAPSVEALRRATEAIEARLTALFDAIEPLTAEMIRSHPMRREELLRRWVEACGGAIEGEAPARSRERLEKLDYRRTLAEYASAEAARKAEAEERQRLLREAQEREAAARGWRE